MSQQLKSHDLTFTMIGALDASDGHDRYWRVEDDNGDPIDESRLNDALIELFYQPSSGAGSQYCTFFNRFPHEYSPESCVVAVEWRYDI